MRGNGRVPRSRAGRRCCRFVCGYGYRRSSEVAHDVVIGFGDGQEPEPTPDPEPTPEPDPDPMPSPEQKPDLKPVDKDAKTTTTVATKTAAGAKNTSGVLAATGDNAATTAAALGIAGASVTRRLHRVQAPQQLALAFTAIFIRCVGISVFAAAFCIFVGNSLGSHVRT